MDISRWIDRQAAFAPSKTALRFEGESLSYADLAAAIARAAGALRALGVKPGDAVAWLGQNHPLAIELLFACARLGAMFVPLNWRLAAPEHEQVLRDCTPKVVVAEPRYVAALDGIRAALAPARYVVAGAAGPRWTAWDEIAARGAPVAAGAAVVAGAPAGAADAGGPDDPPLLLCYTSGSTGAPKGVLLTQGALFWNAVHSAHMHDLTRADTILTTLPLFHVGGMNIQTLPALHAGATVVLHAKFDPDAVFDALRDERPALTVLVPAQLDMMFAHPRWADCDLSALRMVSTGSMIVPDRCFETLHARGIPLIQVYGSTETAPIATYISVADAVRKAGSAGKPALHCDVRVVAGGAAAAPGMSGDVQVRGPNVMIGYWRAPEATREALQDGWFDTGDIGHFDDEGFLWIDGRKKDMIISGGENIYPAEIENALSGVRGIAEVAVVGRPDEKWGEVAVAVVVPATPGTLDAPEVLKALEGRIARFKHPRDVRFVDALPRSALGKIRKDELRRLVRDEDPAPGH